MLTIFQQMGVMNRKSIFSSLILGFCCITSPSNLLYSLNSIHQCSCVNAVASLNFHTEALRCSVETGASSDQEIQFSTDEVNNLWEKVSHEITVNPLLSSSSRISALFEDAHRYYLEGYYLLREGQTSDAKKFLRRSLLSLNQLWQEGIECEDKEFLSLSNDPLPKRNLSVQNDSPFELPEAAKIAMHPYCLPSNHPMYSVLESIFAKRRVTTDESHFCNAGFQIIAKRPRSYILVAKHSKLPGYLLKAYLDNEKRLKQGTESWEWLVLRCKGANKVRKIIQQHEIKHFVVADKWIYPLPTEPSPPISPVHTRHLAALLVTDMELVPEKRNLHAWYHYVTKEYLDELYVIMSRAKGSSYRPDNIAYTLNGTFAFIDTEYPARGPDFESIRKHLRRATCKYWDKLVKNGG